MPEDLVVESDPGKLAIVFSNLLDNAVSHGRPEGPTRCTATAKDGTFAVEIANPADPLGEKETRSLAEPFWRKDGAGTADAHSGLGLPLVAALAKLLDLEVDFRQDAGTFRVLLRAALPQGRPKVSQKFPEEHSLAIARRQRRQKP